MSKKQETYLRVLGERMGVELVHGGMTDGEAHDRIQFARARLGMDSITDKQAAFLRDIQEALGVPYSGDGLTYKQASFVIRRHLALAREQGVEIRRRAA